MGTPSGNREIPGLPATGGAAGRIGKAGSRSHQGHLFVPPDWLDLTLYQRCGYASANQ